MLQWRLCYHFTKSLDRNITCILLQSYLLYIYLLTNTVSLFSQTLLQYTPRCLTRNLTRAVSYGTYGTHIVIYIPVLAMNEGTALSLGLCEASDLIGCFMICMLRVVQMPLY